MREEENKRKIKNRKTLEGRYLKGKLKVEDINKFNNEVKEEKESKEAKKDVSVEKKEKSNKVGPFQLVVIKLPWYKRMVKSIIGFFGFGY